MVRRSRTSFSSWTRAKTGGFPRRRDAPAGITSRHSGKNGIVFPNRTDFCANSKTIFLCRYLHSEELRREINEGLNVVEQWNGATDFVFFARRGELSSNRRKDHEISMLALHLIQNCMIYINTLMIQQVLLQQTKLKK